MWFLAGGTADVWGGQGVQAFGRSELLVAFKARGERCGQKEYWVAGKASVGLKGFVMLWE